MSVTPGQDQIDTGEKDLPVMIVGAEPRSGPQWLTRRQLPKGAGGVGRVLTWWEGKVGASTFGRGEGVMLDSSYHEVARVRAGNGRQMDLHEFVLTPQGTALFTCYPETVRADLSSVGGPSDGQAREAIIQEVDVHSGRVRFEWRSLDHIPVTESYQSLAEPYDYLHANSIDVAPDGNLLVSARHTWALYK